MAWVRVEWRLAATDTIKIAIVMLVASVLLTPASAQSSAPGASFAPAGAPVLPRQKPKSSSDYYVEFRVARIGLYGHSYAAYGRLDRRGNPENTSYADLHPMGGYAVMALGHFVPVPANTEWDPEVLALPVTFKYRVNLNEAQYNNLTAAVQRASANKLPYWNAVTNNCNHFVGELAKAVGLRVPMQFHLSYGFIPDLQELNESNAPSAAVAATPRVKRSTAASASTETGASAR
jgi:hypothetical protein